MYVVVPVKGKDKGQYRFKYKTKNVTNTKNTCILSPQVFPAALSARHFFVPAGLFYRNLLSVFRGSFDYISKKQKILQSFACNAKRNFYISARKLFLFQNFPISPTRTSVMNQPPFLTQFFNASFHSTGSHG